MAADRDIPRPELEQEAQGTWHLYLKFGRSTEKGHDLYFPSLHAFSKVVEIGLKNGRSSLSKILT